MPLIDHIAKIDVDEAIGLNELTTLNCLAGGLVVLNQQVRVIEAPLIEDERVRQKKVFLGFGL